MLTRLQIRNFRRLDDVDVELGERVVLVGPNNSGKTTALQALTLWDLGVRRWIEKRGDKPTPTKRPGVTINRRDLLSVPVPETKLLWLNGHVRDTIRQSDQPTKTKNILIEIEVSGVNGGVAWRCPMLFDYANTESFYCKPLTPPTDIDVGSDLFQLASERPVSFLPTMSGLAANETRIDAGAINVRLGEGRTAEVLRNLCYQVAENEKRWRSVCIAMKQLFGVQLQRPEYQPQRGEIQMAYRDETGNVLDLSCSGRGFQQTLLLSAYLNCNPGSVVLIDEPDAHLEILRQRQIYDLIGQIARDTGSQVIAASHSEVVLNEAADRDTVVAFVGRPHRIDDRERPQVRKALIEIGYDQYLQAEQRGWVLYLEGSTDLAVLRAFAVSLRHPIADHLSDAFVKYVANDPQAARSHFFGLRQAKPDLRGVAIFDRLERGVQTESKLKEIMWRQREIENYLDDEAVLIRWAERFGKSQEGPLFTDGYVQQMKDSINRVREALAIMGKTPFTTDIKASDDFLNPLFRDFFQAKGLPNLLRKSDYHQLAELVSVDLIDKEISEVLDTIYSVVTMTPSSPV